MAKTKPKKTVTTKSKTSSKVAQTPKKDDQKSKKKTVKASEVAEKKVEKVEKVNTVKEKSKDIPFKKEKKDDGFFKILFAKKCDKNENILTIFKNKKIWGAIIGEIVGTMLLSIILLTLGAYQPLYMFFVMVGLTMITFGLSGANLNPIITAGMLATRRMPAIRGVLYFIAQILGAWLGFLIVKAFCVASGQEPTDILPKMAGIETETFWLVTMIEFVGAFIIGLAFVRALVYKRSALTFAMLVAGGFVIAMLVAVIISSNFASLSDNFILNPAIALMYQILPTSGAEASEILGNIAIALATYVVFPMLGGISAFYISDIASVFSGEKLDM